MADAHLVVAPESERILYGERRTAEYVVANPLNIEVEMKSGEIRRPQDIRERVTRCRDCFLAFTHLGSMCCENFSNLEDGYYAVVKPDGFCSWGQPRDGDA